MSDRERRYRDAVSLDRAAFRLRDELRRGRPRERLVKAYLKEIRRATERVER